MTGKKNNICLANIKRRKNKKHIHTQAHTRQTHYCQRINLVKNRHMAWTHCLHMFRNLCNQRRDNRLSPHFESASLMFVPCQRA